METMRTEQELQRLAAVREMLDELLVAPSPEVLARRRKRFMEAVDNSTRHVKRSLLDFIDLKMHQGDDPDVRKTLDLVKRRIHNDVSMSREQILAAFIIFNNHGEIPAFGREQDELDGAAAGHDGPQNGHMGGPVGAGASLKGRG